MYQPLADLLRPTTLDEVYGQEHILGEGAILRRLIESGNVPNMIFYGPSGTGKTTVANIIAQQTKRTLYKLNATTASTADINIWHTLILHNHDLLLMVHLRNQIHVLHLQVPLQPLILAVIHYQLIVQSFYSYLRMQ